MNNLEQAAAAAIAAWERDGANYDAFCQRMDALREALAAHRRAELVVEAVAIVQHRKQHCADWYDGHADHADGGGPYEERVLYTHPPEPLPEPAEQDELAEVVERSMRLAFLLGQTYRAQADSVSVNRRRLSKETRQVFIELMEETRLAVGAGRVIG